MSGRRNNKKQKLTAAELTAAIEHIDFNSEEDSEISDLGSLEESSGEDEGDVMVGNYESVAIVEGDLLRLTFHHFLSSAPATARKFIYIQRLYSVCSSKKVDGRKVHRV